MSNIFIFRNSATYSLLMLVACYMLCCNLAACKKSPTDGVHLNITSDIFKYSVFVGIVDSANAQVVPSNISMAIFGQNASDVYEISGKKIYNVHSNGTIALAINPSVLPTDNVPLTFSVMVTAPGYLPSYKQITFTPNVNSQQVKIKMTNVASPATGMSYTFKDIPTVNGVVTSAALIKPSSLGTGIAVQSVGQNTTGSKVTYDTNADNLASTQILFPAGTTFTDYCTGKQWTGKLSVAFIINTLSPQWINTVSNGFAFNSGAYDSFAKRKLTTVAGDVLEARQLLFTDATQQNIGYDIYEVDASGNYVGTAKVSNPVSVYSVLNPAAINPLTKAVIKAGDMIELYNQDIAASNKTVTTGRKAYDASTVRVPVQQASNGKLYALINSADFGFNFGYYKAAAHTQLMTYNSLPPGIDKTNCSLMASFHYVPDANSANYSALASLEIAVSNGYYDFKYPATHNLGYLSTDGKPVKLQIFNGVSLVNEVPDVSTQGNLDVYGPPYGDFTPYCIISMYVSVTCPKRNDLVIYPNGYVEVYEGTTVPANTPPALVLNVVGGAVNTTSLKQGKTYTFVAHSGTATISTTQTMPTKTYSNIYATMEGTNTDICNNF